VNFRLDRKLKGETEFKQAAFSDKYEMNVPLVPDDPTGLYVFNMVLTYENPTNELLSGEAVLASCTTVGVLRVTSAATNTVTAVPWMSMDTETAENEPIEVSETVNPNGLSDGTREGGGGDQILVYDAAADAFRRWKKRWLAVGSLWPGWLRTVKPGWGCYRRCSPIWRW
jgi:hypothetical protein